MVQLKLQKKTVRGSSEHKIRIVGGQWKRTPLLVADMDGLRPTPERVRETLFNWISCVYDGNFENLSCLDAFAGTGALGFEVASRGAKQVVLIEQNKLLCQAINTVKKKLQAQQVAVRQDSAMRSMGYFIEQGKQFDIIFLDPPFKLNLLPIIFPLCAKILSAQSLVYIESDFLITQEQLMQWLNDENKIVEIIRQGKAGQVFFHLCRISDR